MGMQKNAKTVQKMTMLSDKHVVVTGGGRGIGAAIAAEMNRLGAKVTLMGRTLSALQTRAQQLARAGAVQVDVTDEKIVQAGFDEAIARFGPVDILINNAGTAHSSSFARTDSDNWQQTLAVNLNGVFYCSRQVLDGMLEADWGRIINIASTAGLTGYAYVTAYCAAKHGVVGLTRSLALELAGTGITVNAICPGYTNTDLIAGAITRIVDKTGMTREDAEARLKSTNPQRRFIEPEEVAGAVSWLCLPGSESITGQSIPIAGGEVM